MFGNGFRAILRTVGSLWFAAVLLVLMLFAMACATVFETMHGSEQAREIFYRAWWFQGLLGIFGLNGLASILMRLPLRRKHVGFLITHLSLLCVLIGAYVTHVYGIDGQVGIAEGQTVDQFRDTEREALILTRQGDNTQTSLELDPRVFGKFAAASFDPPPALRQKDFRIEVLRYLPDAEPITEVTPVSDARFPAAAQVAMTSPEGAYDEWVIGDHDAVLGTRRVMLRVAATPRELEGLLAPASQPAGGRTLKVTYQGQTWEIPLRQALSGAVPIGETGYRIHVLRYMPHAMVGKDRKISNASNRPVNPAVEFEITGHDLTEHRVAFAKFPGFRHGDNQIKDMEVTFVTDADTAPLAPIEIIAAPDGKLYARFQTGAAPPTTRPLAPGAAIDTPWTDTQLVVRRFLPHARQSWGMRPVTPAREQRTEAIRIRLVLGDHTEEAWITKYSPQQVNVGTDRYTLLYSDRSLPLGFSLRLDSFTITTYPGTGQPRTFESRITVEDQAGKRNYLISMNNPAKIGRYHLYQSSYKLAGSQRISYLSVSWDPGQPLVFAGYFGLMGGMLVVMAIRAGEQRQRKQRAATAAQRVKETEVAA